MTEQELLVKLMYEKHHKLILNMKEAPIEWHSSYSATTKLFGGKNALSEKFILENKLIPQWIVIGKQKMWKITDIVAWVLETEHNYKDKKWEK